jgi:hypothetical protein
MSLDPGPRSIRPMKTTRSTGPRAPRPELLPPKMRGEAAQARPGRAPGGAWPGAPRPELLPRVERPPQVRGKARPPGPAVAPGPGRPAIQRSAIQRMNQDLDDLSDKRTPNKVKWKGAGWQTAIPDNIYVKKVYLLGDWTSGRHQEVLCELERPYEGKYIRVSRTNGEDTFQYSATWEFKNPMPVLAESAPKDVHVAVGTIAMVFLEVHSQWEYYDQAGCQVFAQEIFKKLTGVKPGGDKGKSKSSKDSDDDDFFM